MPEGLSPSEVGKEIGEHSRDSGDSGDTATSIGAIGG